MNNINFKTDNQNINNLIQEIKRKSGKDLEIFYGEMTIGANETLMCNITDGIPKITIKTSHDFTEEEIYHELFHLFIKLENGICTIEFSGDLLNFVKKHIQEPSLFLSKVHSILQHAYFFQKMINNRFSPGKYLENQLKNCLDRYEYVYQNDKDIHNALDVWHIALSMEDKNLGTKLYLKKLKKINQNNYNQGMKLFEISKKFTDPNKEADVFCNVLRELLKYTSDIRYSKNNFLATYA